MGCEHVCWGTPGGESTHVDQALWLGGDQLNGETVPTAPWKTNKGQGASKQDGGVVLDTWQVPCQTL